MNPLWSIAAGCTALGSAIPKLTIPPLGALVFMEQVAGFEMCMVRCVFRLCDGEPKFNVQMAIPHKLPLDQAPLLIAGFMNNELDKAMEGRDRGNL